MSSGPMRMTALANAAFARSIVIAVVVNTENGAVVPFGHSNRMLAGVQTKLSAPHDNGVGDFGVEPAVCTLSSSFTAEA